MMKSGKLVKRSIAAAIAGTMVIGSMSVTAFADEANNISWEYKNGKLTISGTGEIDSYNPAGGIVSPWYDKRFEITEIEISDGITGIGDYAFYECTGLSDVVIPEGLTAIGNSAFECCYALANFCTDADMSGVQIPEDVE